MTKTKPARAVALVRSPEADGVGVVKLTLGKVVQHYVFWEIPCEIGGRGFAVHRLGIGDLYHMRVGTRVNCSCECMGWYAHESCKHVGALKALARQGKI